MYNRWFLSAVVLTTVAALILVIYLDSREGMPQQPDPLEANGDSPLAPPNLAVGSDTPAALSEQDIERIGYISSVLDTIADTRVRLPFYGELIRLYTEAAYYDSAATWATERARQTGWHNDLLHAAELHLAAMQRTGQEDRIKEEAQKAKEMYISALELKPDDPDVLTDLAVVYMSLLQPESSYVRLEQALRTYPDHLRANFNMGVLLHQMGNIRESIPFFDRSLALSDTPEWDAVVQGYLDRHHNELFH